MKRRAVAQPIDHARDRSLWAVLIRDAHAAVAGDPTIARSNLGDTAVKAQLWNTPAPFPRGLVAPIFSKLVHAWARTPDAQARERLAPLMLAAAGLTDELLDETALDRAAIVIGVDLGSGPSVGVEVEVVTGPDGQRTFTPRLPYAEG